MCVVTAVLSAFLDNVTTVVLTAPITLSIAGRLVVSPVPYLISQILASNIGGTATLIGDPPNILIGSAAGLDFVAVQAMSDLAPGRFGLREPRGTPVPADAMTLFVVPGVGFDRTGRRLGQGGGYYDRVLAACKRPAVGLAFSVQVVDELPVEPHDHPIDWLVTEHGALRTRAA